MDGVFVSTFFLLETSTTSQYPIFLVDFCLLQLKIWLPIFEMLTTCFHEISIFQIQICIVFWFTYYLLLVFFFLSKQSQWSKFREGLEFVIGFS